MRKSSDRPQQFLNCRGADGGLEACGQGWFSWLSFYQNGGAGAKQGFRQAECRRGEGRGQASGGREAAQPPRARPAVRRYPRPRRKSIAFTQVMPSSDEGGAASSVTTVFG